MCYSASIEGQWLTLVGPSFPQLKANTEIDIGIDGQTYRCYVPGINVEIRLGNQTARVAHFLLPSNE